MENKSSRMSLRYSGDGFEMAILMLKNLFLTIVTLGIYRAWATTNLRRYIWGHVSFMDDRATYSGLGIELFRGWVKLIGIFIVGYVLAGLIGLVFPFAGLIMIAVYALMFALATYAGLRYRMSRTSWRQIHFGVDKNKALTNEFLKLYFLGVFLNILTLGIYYPWFKNSIRKFLTNKSRFGSSYFAYEGDGTEYAGIFWSNLLLTILTLGIYLPWMVMNLAKFRCENTSFQGKYFELTLKGGEFFKFAIVAYLLTILTLGIAGPWMYNWGLKLFIENIHLDGMPDMALVSARESDGSAMADDIVEGYDLDFGF